MREQYTITKDDRGAMMLPNNTFQKLFSPRDDITNPINFQDKAEDGHQEGEVDIINTYGRKKTIRLKEGQKLLLQDPY